MASFAAVVGDWCKKIPEAEEAIFRESCQELVEQLNSLCPVGETGFLRASLMASNSELPQLTRKNPGGSHQPDMAQIEMVINSSELGSVIFLGYSAEYGGYVHYGARGNAPRPWVTMVAQRWIAIVEAKAAEVKQRLGL